MRRRMFVALVTPLILVNGLAPAALADESRQYFDAATAADSEALPYSGAVLAGDTLYLAGRIGLEADDSVPETAAEEAKLVLDDMKAALEKAGMTMDDLVFVQVFCSDVAHYAEFNRVYRTYFTGEFPARAFLGAGTLLFDARFEVQGIAVRR
ncbi:MAG: Rid family hydrolase [Gammaproteobacteria bacterium]|nr:Rid family hydrolase [Gammaproteobacteria bacterium]MDH4256036.1 Rid family hydrolase [Gammaproteobacteria bacterium]MDH5310093.1 Rid family hydrolase [Gammaproteobacteria bacterium]